MDMTENAMVLSILLFRFHVLMPCLHIVHHLIEHLLADILRHVVGAFVSLDDDMEELVDALSRTTDGWHHRHPNQFAQLLVIQLVSACFQFIEHVQCNHHLHVHVDELRGEIEVALQIRRIHYVDDKVRSFLNDVLADIDFFG